MSKGWNGLGRANGSEGQLVNKKQVKGDGFLQGGDEGFICLGAEADVAGRVENTTTPEYASERSKSACS